MLQQTRNQENVRAGVKIVARAARPAASKRTVLEEIGNDAVVPRFLVPRKVGADKLNVPLRK
jgi:hypothetical protein